MWGTTRSGCRNRASRTIVGTHRSPIPHSRAIRPRPKPKPDPSNLTSQTSVRQLLKMPVDANNPQFPTFDELPYRKGDPGKACWGFWPEDDQMGMLNLLTPERIVEAKKEIQTGLVGSLKYVVRKDGIDGVAGGCRILNILGLGASLSSIGCSPHSRANLSTMTSWSLTLNLVGLSSYERLC